MMSMRMRRIIFTAAARPSQVMWRRSQRSHMAVPLVKNRFMTAVKMTMIKMGFKPLVKDRNGTLEARMHTVSTAATMA